MQTVHCSLHKMLDNEKQTYFGFSNFLLIFPFPDRQNMVITIINTDYMCTTVLKHGIKCSHVQYKTGYKLVKIKLRAKKSSLAAAQISHVDWFYLTIAFMFTTTKLLRSSDDRRLIGEGLLRRSSEQLRGVL